MLSQHVSAKRDMLSQDAKYRQVIPAHIAKVIIYKGLLEPRTADKLLEGVKPDQRISRANTTTLQETRQGIRHEALRLQQLASNYKQLED